MAESFVAVWGCASAAGASAAGASATAESSGGRTTRARLADSESLAASAGAVSSADGVPVIAVAPSPASWSSVWFDVSISSSTARSSSDMPA